MRRHLLRNLQRWYGTIFLEGVTFADNDTLVYAAGVVIRPTEPNSPKPDPGEIYGSFVAALKVSPKCQ